MPKKNEKKAQPAAGYPTQPVMQSPLPYSLQPTQPVLQSPLPYSLQPTAPSMVNQPGTNPFNSSVPAMHGMPPPPPNYDQAMHHQVVPSNYGNHTSYVPVQPQHQLPMQSPSPYYPPQVHAQQVHPQATFVVHNAFDAGARFDSTSQVRVPPPPPGIAPNAAQVAYSTGHNVVLGKKKDKFFTGGSDGGATFW